MIKRFLFTVITLSMWLPVRAQTSGLEAYFSRVDWSTNPTDSALAADSYLYLEELESEDVPEYILSSKSCNSLDQKLHIYSYQVEGCGAYCSTYHLHALRYSNKGQEHLTFSDFAISGMVDTIYQLNDSVYLIFGSGNQRPRGIEHLYGRFTTLIKVSPTPVILWNRNFFSSSLTQAGYEMNFDVEPKLIVNPNDYSLTYHFSFIEFETDLTVTVIGKCIWNGTEYICEEQKFEIE